MAYSRYCPECKVDWPHVWPDFKECRHCGTATTQRHGDAVIPLEMDQVASVLRRLEFDDYCNRRDVEQFIEHALSTPAEPPEWEDYIPRGL